ncbi:tetratricopeptide (TPR) repeat protein [Pseudomonas nitritireducens]|uniref:Tetratricopeptide (TPR) repeat protein n=1 Tax=Pseudomonas nitroreducens TaxID=46680 RepID=A0A7W7KQW2_PSENT|nr:hypothetical protein [Pseudomonas nitritireducens]MBB4866833.1 tetratricopeptide (TPR) repeat protein [Pseudomonas nitritireducens]
MTTQSSKKLSHSDIFWWVGTAALVVIGAGSFRVSWAAGLFMIAIAAMISPFVFQKILAKLGIADRIQIRVFITWIAIVGTTIIYMGQLTHLKHQEEARLAAEQKQRAEQAAIAEAEALKVKAANFQANRTAIMADINKSIEAKEVGRADSLLRQQSGITDPELMAATAKYKEMVQKWQDDAKAKSLKAELAKLQPKEYSRAADIYGKLLDLYPGNKAYQVAKDKNSKLADAEEAAAAKRRIEETKQAERTKKIEAQFSGWDGSHRGLERVAKSMMKNPDSFEHVETRYSDKGKYIRVGMTYRGTNSFGAVVPGTIVADFDLEGNLIKIVSQ